MYYPITLSPELALTITQTLKLPRDSQILDITAFGDIFIQTGPTVTLYSFTDGTISDVSDLIEEFGLPPVNLDLGDQWYQVSAQAMLHEKQYILNSDECFCFKQALYNEGVYGPENIIVIKILDYYAQRLQQLTRTTHQHQ
ncbi:hypothetical protein [Marinagarivorans algicola]|uniref:hypothetical protein n=1 Tax=Marinagarivorans algicola TaxID=1513270 RepID=UPI0006B5EE84|nr:hypothetical protein [Marinagarivorans algicola]